MEPESETRGILARKQESTDIFISTYTQAMLSQRGDRQSNSYNGRVSPRSPCDADANSACHDFLDTRLVGSQRRGFLIRVGTDFFPISPWTDRLTLCSTVTSPLVGPDRDRPSASSIKATTPFQAAIGITLLVDIICTTSDFTVEPRATCEPWVKHTCLDEQDRL